MRPRFECHPWDVTAGRRLEHDRCTRGVYRFSGTIESAGDRQVHCWQTHNAVVSLVSPWKRAQSSVQVLLILSFCHWKTNLELLKEINPPCCKLSQKCGPV